jgi:cysteinyl-tRNA synthetase
MKIYLHNNLSDQKELFKPVHKHLFSKNEMRMYNCGPTVYSRGHIGHARPYVFADLLHRMFEYDGYNVKQVINITDVGHLVSDADSGEDKVEKAAKETGQKAREITEKYTSLFFDDLKSLNIDISKITFPRATENIPEQIKIIEDLEKKGFTYKTSDGIYYNTLKFDGYGKLGRIDIKGLKEGARIDANEEKKNATDFALWKFSNPNEHREQEWDSPWGVGFPGWHLECSAMSKKYLGQPFDIHTGGIDHIPTHHNNEIAQSEGAYKKPQAIYWLHSGHILIDSEKMSKSIGNTVYLADLNKKGIDILSYRYWLLTSHYSTLVNVTDESIGAADTAFKKLINKFIGITLGKVNKNYLDQILEKICDDLNTPEAIAIIWGMLKDKNVSDSDAFATVIEADKILGLNIENLVKNTNTADTVTKIPEEIEKLVKERQTARISKNFVLADEIRQKITNLGYEIYDYSDGSKVEKKKI